jgi:amidase
LKVITINKLDAICGLTMGPACEYRYDLWRSLGDVLTTPAAASGYHILCPGKVYDFLLGFHFGPAYSA